jgi:MFS family permease
MRRRTPLYGWLIAEALSLTGTRVSMLALPWFVLTTTGSPTQTGLVAFAELLPLVLMKVLGGPIIDKVGPRRIAILCDLLSVVVVGAIPLLYAGGLLSFPLLLVLVALAGALRGPGDGAKHAMTPALVESAGVPMERATGLHSTIERGSSMLGFAFAGALVVLIGPAQALVVDAISFGLSALVLAWATRGMGPAARPEEGADELPYLRQLREGWDFLRGDRVLLGIAMMVAFTNLVDIAWTSVLVPVWAKETGGGAAAIGLLFATMSAAAVAGAITAAAIGERLPRYKTYLLAFLICGAPRFLVMAWDLPLWVVLAVIISSGFGSGFLNPILGAVIYERIPNRLVGRVTSLTTSMCFALMPLGGLLGGGLVSAFGLWVAMLASGAAYFCLTMLPALDPRWREMDDRPSSTEDRVLETVP